MTSLVLKLVDRAEGSSVRGMIGPDGLQVFSVYDFISIACGYKDTGATARKVFKRLTSDGSEYMEETVSALPQFTLPWAERARHPLHDYQGAPEAPDDPWRQSGG